MKFEPLEAEGGEGGASAAGFEFCQEIKGGTVPKEYIPGVAKVRVCLRYTKSAGASSVDDSPLSGWRRGSSR